jgi:hypothetical protein
MDFTKTEASCGKSMNGGTNSGIIKGLFSCLLNCIIAIIVLGILGALFIMLYLNPPCSARMSADRAAVATRGRDIYVAILGANKDRETELLPPIWPKTCLTSTNLTDDISGKAFKTSTEYFAALYDEEHLGTEKWKPWVSGFNYSRLAGTGVSEKKGTGKLLADNNMWMIAANVTPEDSDLIPVLITRNVDVKEIERLVNCGGDTSNLKVRIPIGQGVYKTPFGDKGFVLVRKGGGTFANTAKYSRLDYIFRSETLPPRDPSKPPIMYLMP